MKYYPLNTFSGQTKREIIDLIRAVGEELKEHMKMLAHQDVSDAYANYVDKELSQKLEEFINSIQK